MLHAHFCQDLVERAEKALDGKISADSSSPTIRNKRLGRSWERGFHSKYHHKISKIILGTSMDTIQLGRGHEVCKGFGI